MDLLPTFAELADGTLPTAHTIDGCSLWPLLSGATNRGPHDEFYYFGGSAPGKVRLQAVRDRRWKLFVTENEQGKLETGPLYDLARDGRERTDRAHHHPQVAQRLHRTAETFFQELRKNVRPMGRLASN